jgi:hypothetical protein
MPADGTAIATMSGAGSMASMSAIDGLSWFGVTRQWKMEWEEKRFDGKRPAFR